MNDPQNPSSFTSKSLAEATVQEIQLELMRRASFNEFDGQRVTVFLEQHRDLWLAVIMDSTSSAKKGDLPFSGLIKLRDLPGNSWNVDTMYILTPDMSSAWRLGDLIEQQNWGDLLKVFNVRETEDAIGSNMGEGYGIVSVWWD